MPFPRLPANFPRSSVPRSSTCIIFGFFSFSLVGLFPTPRLQCRSDSAGNFPPELIYSAPCHFFPSMTSHRSFDSYSPFPPQSKRMTQSQTPGLDTLAEGSQYALEQLQLAREAGATVNTPTDTGTSLPDSKPSRHTQHLLYSEKNNPSSGLKDQQSRDSLADARSVIRKNSSATPVRRRISRACDQCNQLRTKCDGQNPCAHCLGMKISGRKSPLLRMSINRF